VHHAKIRAIISVLATLLVDGRVDYKNASSAIAWSGFQKEDLSALVEAFSELIVILKYYLRDF